MKKITKWLLLILLVLCTAAFIVYYRFSQAGPDRTAPVISMEAEEITLSVGDGQEAYLAGVTALDDVDGDVTAMMVVEGVSAIDSRDCVTITYAAFDRAGNVAKAHRTGRYTDYEGPKFALKNPLVFYSGYTIDLLDHITASDPLDGDLSARVKATLSGGETDLSQEGTHPVDLRVTNSMGDTARITVPVEICSYAAYDATVNLTDYLIYWEKGSPFQAEDYLVSLYAGYREITPEQLGAEGAQIDIHSDVNPDEPGSYSVSYTITYGSYTGFTRLIVVVED